LLPFDYLSNQKQSTKKCISRGLTLHTVVGHFQLWNFFVDLDMLNMFAVSTYHLSLIVFEIKDEKYKNFENLMKKGK
jgi:hypothetical protein